MASGLEEGRGSLALIDGAGVAMDGLGDPREKPKSPIRGPVGIVEFEIDFVIGSDVTAASRFAA